MNEYLTGVWTYRSFLNIPEPVDDLNKLLFGQGEMVFESAAEPGTVRGQLAFRSSPPRQDDPRLTLVGSAQTGTPFSVRFQGTGVEGTSAAGWVHDYVGYFVPKWPDGKGQRPALVGSVIRTVLHDGTPAGVVGSFIAVQRDFLEPRMVIPLPDNVRDMLASRHHRLHHTVWHSTRNMWLLIAEDQKKQIRDLGWQPGGKEERPAIRAGAPIVRNGSGEDFLFMHRKMMQEVNTTMKEAGQGPIRAWNTIPAPGPVVVEPDFSLPGPKLPPPGNPDGFTVPPAWFDPVDEVTNRRIRLLKTDGHYWSRMRWWDREFKNPQYLSTLTLGELGALIEWSVHNDMHMRWASVPRDPQSGTPIPAGRADNDIREVWDDPNYDFLGEFYSSHVNPVFWRLHGWVDDRINDWFQAHEAVHTGEVVPQDVHGIPWFEKGKWVHTESPWAGPDESHGHGGHGAGTHYDVGKMEKVVAILFGPPPADTAALTVEATRIEPLPQRATRFTWF